MNYTGMGGNDLLGNKKQIQDQTLVPANLSLITNCELSIPVRVIRKNADPCAPYGSVYVYDGLYDVTAAWEAQNFNDQLNKSFRVYQYRLKRREGQAPSLARPSLFKGTISAKKNANPLTMPGIVCKDLSKGLEKLPVSVVNEIDDELPPGLDPVADAELLIDAASRQYVKSSLAFQYCTSSVHAQGVQPPLEVRLTESQRQNPHRYVPQFDFDTLTLHLYALCSSLNMGLEESI